MKMAKTLINNRIRSLQNRNEAVSAETILKIRFAPGATAAIRIKIIN